MGTKVFFLSDTSMVRRYLRRYSTRRTEKACACGSYCDAMNCIGDFMLPADANGRMPVVRAVQSPSDYVGNENWPTFAPCGYMFDPEDEWQVFERLLYLRPDNSLVTWEDALPGAVRNCWWMPKGRRDDEGRFLEVKLPTGHTWNPQARASNCTMPDDHTHRCWVQHGRPEDGTLHVDKVGLTCAAGAGSIVVPGWHGFLHNGELRSC
jgi:hypothetical protein